METPDIIDALLDGSLTRDEAQQLWEANDMTAWEEGFTEGKKSIETAEKESKAYVKLVENEPPKWTKELASTPLNPEFAPYEKYSPEGPKYQTISQNVLLQIEKELNDYKRLRAEKQREEEEQRIATWPLKPFKEEP